MLTEIRSNMFRTNSIQFRSGLNVILGDENGTNSIGKSALLMVIDFAFGGDDLLSHNKDVVKELGDHDYFFSFLFEEETYRFRRGTYEDSVVYVCDEAYSPVRSIDIQEYTAFLKKSYTIDLPDLSFRALVSLYLRIWGKDNLSVERPLHVVQRQSAHECVDRLIKVFGQYETIRELSVVLESLNAKVKALNEATRQAIVPAVSKRDYSDNQKRIKVLEGELTDIRENLAKYATNLSAIVNKEVLQLKLEKDRLLELRLTFAGRLQRVQSNLRENRAIRSESFRDLANFFPDVNQDRLIRVEEFHNGVAKLLRIELQDSERQFELEITRIDNAISEIDTKMSQTLNSVEEPTTLIDRVFNVAVTLEDCKGANAHYENEIGLRTELKNLRASLAEEKEKILSNVQAIINDGMHRIVSSVFGDDRKSPRLSLSENNYQFEVYEDTGTGTAYASLVVFDLTVFLATKLPIVAHDTLLFKNIENSSVAALMGVYMNTPKQSFVALDEIKKYGPDTAALLEQRSVIRLDNDHVLYVKDWRR